MLLKMFSKLVRFGLLLSPPTDERGNNVMLGCGFLTVSVYAVT